MTARPQVRLTLRSQDVSSRTLVARARDGDRDAFERLATEAMPALLGTARRLLGNGFAAEEAVADALFRAWQQMHGFRGEAAFSTWLHRIVCRVAADRYRRARRDQKRREKLVARGRRACAPVPDRLDRREQRAALRAAIDRLPERQRLVLILHAWEGLDLRETARVLDLRYATAKSNLCHARKALRILIAEDEA